MDSDILTGIYENLQPPTSRFLNDMEVRSWSGSLLGIFPFHKTPYSSLKQPRSYCLQDFHMVGQFSLVRHGLLRRKEDCCISTTLEMERESANTEASWNGYRTQLRNEAQCILLLFFNWFSFLLVCLGFWFFFTYSSHICII